MKDTAALRPEAFNLTSFINKEKVEVEPNVEEEILAQGAEGVFWKTLVKHFENSIQQLEEINEQAIAGGMAFEEIGRNALVISQVKGIIRKVINVVGDAKEAVDGRQKK